MLEDLKLYLEQEIGLFNPQNFNRPNRFFEFPGKFNPPVSIEDNCKLIHSGEFWILFSPGPYLNSGYHLEIAARIRPDNHNLIQVFCPINNEALINLLGLDFPDLLTSSNWALLCNSAYRQGSIEELALSYLLRGSAH